MLNFIRKFWLYDVLRNSNAVRAILLPIFLFVCHSTRWLNYYCKNLIVYSRESVFNYYCLKLRRWGWRSNVRRARALFSRKARDPSLVVMIVISDVSVDPRVEREACELAKAGYHVTIIAPDLYGGQTPNWGQNITFKLFKSDACHALHRFPHVFSEELTVTALEESPLAFHCHDINTVVAGSIASWRRGASLVVDMHEWFSENVSESLDGALTPHSGLRRAMYQWAERLALRKADAVVTVCQSIADELKKVHTRHIDIIRNVPSLSPAGDAYPPLKEQIGIAPEKFVLLYQGGVGPTRNLEPMIAALPLLPDDVVFVIRGPGMKFHRARCEQLAAELGVADRVICAPPVPSADVVRAARGADAGLWSLKPLCKNFEYALPNKVFEYLWAGIPVLAADLPEIRRTVIEPGLGYGFDHSDPASIAHSVMRLRKDVLAKQRVERIKISSDWPILIEIYQELKNKSCDQLSHSLERHRLKMTRKQLVSRTH